MNVIEGYRIVEHAQPDPFLCFKKPPNPTLTVPLRLKKQLFCMTGEFDPKTASLLAMTYWVDSILRCYVSMTDLSAFSQRWTNLLY